MPVGSLPDKHAASSSTGAERARVDAAYERQAPRRSRLWYVIARATMGFVARSYSSVHVEGSESLPAGPVLLCFSHQCWIDPMYVLAAVPHGPRVYFFGPQEGDMRRGLRNRLMRSFGLVIPFAPGARGLLAATHRSVDLARGGATIAIAGEGRIHSGESYLLPLKEGAAYIALRAGIPLVPVAINGTGWVGFRRRVRVRFGAAIAVPREPMRRPAPEQVAALTGQAFESLAALVQDFGDQRPSGRVGRWLTELFNHWPDGHRPEPGTPLP